MGARIVGKMRFVALAAVIAAGLLSRVVRTGWIVADKYLGDALYAVMVYLLLSGPVWRRAAWAMAVMAGMECFQLTGIPAELAGSGSLLVRVCGRLLGTAFGWGDLAAYAVGIACIAAWEAQAKGV